MSGRRGVDGSERDPSDTEGAATSSPHGLVDTIAALATPPGPGALAVVRWSGPGAKRILASVVPTLGDAPEPRRVHLVDLVDPRSGEPVDRGLLTWFPGPASYTGEDVAEFSGHGGPLSPRLVLEALEAAGARLAEPGEFTRRAYLNGKIDLVQAEAVDDLVRGRSTRLRREALRQADRHLSRRIAELREELLQVEALLAHHIDFPDEDEPPVSATVVAERALGLARRLEALAATAPEGERLRSGALVVLAGRPNAGKSSLYNALVGEERALVTEVPGTTRDALEVEIEVDGYPVRLVDTAGLRESDEVVERLGIEVALRFVDDADLVLHCVPFDEEVGSREAEWVGGLGRPVLRVRTKRDRGSGFAASRRVESGGDAGVGGGDADREVPVSVVTGAGLDDLRRAVARRVFARLRARDDEAPVLMRRRQGALVAGAGGEVRAFAEALAEGIPAEFAATHLREAESALEEIVGVVESEAILDRVFASFCIGK